jgi:hypothetical protein
MDTDKKPNQRESVFLFFSVPLHGNPPKSSKAAKILECGGRAQRRHGFSTADWASKAAWLPLCGIPAAVQKDFFTVSPRCVFALNKSFASLRLCVKIGR